MDKDYFRTRTILTITFLLIGFLTWFIPQFVRNITISREEQLCHLDQKNRKKTFKKKIRLIEKGFPDPGYISFTFEDGTKYSKPLGFFRAVVDDFSPGDTLYKPYGELYLNVVNTNKLIHISIEHGCNLADDKHKR